MTGKKYSKRILILLIIVLVFITILASIGYHQYQNNIEYSTIAVPNSYHYTSNVVNNLHINKYWIATDASPESKNFLNSIGLQEQIIDLETNGWSYSAQVSTNTLNIQLKKRNKTIIILCTRLFGAGDDHKFDEKNNYLIEIIKP
jgi:hypothetical protein